MDGELGMSIKYKDLEIGQVYSYRGNRQCIVVAKNVALYDPLQGELIIHELATGILVLVHELKNILSYDDESNEITVDDYKKPWKAQVFKNIQIDKTWDAHVQAVELETQQKEERKRQKFNEDLMVAAIDSILIEEYGVCGDWYQNQFSSFDNKMKIHLTVEDMAKILRLKLEGE